MKEIKLTQGYVAIVDDEDCERVSSHKWCADVDVRADGTTRVYAVRGIVKSDGRWSTQGLHRFILDAKDGLHVDHINGNPLDNRRENMRICTNAENLRNQRPQTGRSSRFRGVCWDKRETKWRARIKMNGKARSLGYFHLELDAARAYDAAALKYYGEFANINCF